MPVRISLLRSIALSALLAFALIGALILVTPSAALASQPSVAKLTVYADGTSVGSEGVGGLAKGHAFLSAKNVSSSKITVGALAGVKPGETVTIGTWGNKSEHAGVWYDLESHFIKQDLAAFATASLSMGLSTNQLSTLNTGIAGRDSYNAITNNCSSFASAMWNRVASRANQLTARESFTLGIDTPTGLMSSILSKTGNKVGAASSIPWSGRGVYYGQKTKAPKASKVWVIKSTPTPPPASTVTLADPDFKACVLDEYAAETGTTITSITTTQMATITTLNCVAQSIVGIQYATGLESYTDGGWTTDVSQLVGLSHLTSLTVSLPQEQTDLTVFEQLPSLTELDILNGDYTDVSPLTQLRSLTSLSLDTNAVPDLTPVMGMASLAHLYINATDLFDVSNLHPHTGLDFSIFTQHVLPAVGRNTATALPAMTAPDGSAVTSCSVNTAVSSGPGTIVDGTIAWTTPGQGIVACTAQGAWGRYSMQYVQYINW